MTAADRPESPEDPLATVLISLVDEGAPGETEIITRMNRARAEMGFVSAERNRWVWDRPEGSAIDLLLKDLGDTAAAPGLRRLALRLLGPSLATVAERAARRGRAAAALGADRRPRPGRDRARHRGGCRERHVAPGVRERGRRGVPVSRRLGGLGVHRGRPARRRALRRPSRLRAAGRCGSGRRRTRPPAPQAVRRCCASAASSPRPGPSGRSRRPPPRSPPTRERYDAAQAPADADLTAITSRISALSAPGRRGVTLPPRRIASFVPSSRQFCPLDCQKLATRLPETGDSGVRKSRFAGEVGGDQVGVPLEGPLPGPLLGDVVDVYQTEPLRVAVGPLEVVQQ